MESSTPYCEASSDLDSSWKDLRFAFRALARTPLVSGVAVLILALAIGAASSLFSVLYGLLIRPLPVGDPDRLVQVHETYPTMDESYVSFPNYLAWKRESDVFEGMTAYTSRTFDLVEGGLAESVTAEIVTANFFEFLGVQPAMGRAFAEPEDGPVCLVSHRLWERLWSSDPELVGRTLKLGRLYPTVVGILPEGFERWRSPADVWIALESAPSLFPQGELSSRGYMLFSVIGRLKSGVSEDVAQASMDRLARRIASEDPKAENGVGLAPLREHLVDSNARRGVWLSMASVGLVLLIACANVSSLLLSLATVRERELAIRRALGASSFRLFRQSTFEGLLLSLSGGLLAICIAWVSTKLLDAARPPVLERFPVDVTGSVILFGLGAAVATGVLVSLSSSFHAMALAGSPDSRKRPGGESARGLLVVSQIALAFVLLVGTELLLQSLVHLRRVHQVSAPERLLQVFVSLPGERYPHAELEKQQVYRKELVEATASLAGVEAVNLATSVPAPSAGYRSSVSLDDGRRFQNGNPATRAMTPGKHAVSPGHFRILGVPLKRGRDFDESDGPDSPRVAIVNETMARLFWPGEDPLLQELRFRNDGPWYEIVGVVGDISYGSPRNRLKPEVYVSLDQQPSPAFWLLVRSRNDAGLLKKSVAERIRRVDPLVPLEQQTMAEALALSIAETRYLAWALTAFAALALILCGTGVFAVGTFSVARRTFEFGVRIALGARSADIWTLVVKRTLVLTILGVASGVGTAFLVTRFLETFLFEVERQDPAVLLAASGFLTACSLLAVLAPARRATAVDPSVALRLER